MNSLKVILVAITLLAALASHAQIRHVRGIRSIDAYYLQSKFGYGAGLSYVKYFSSSVYGKGSVFLEQGDDSGMSYRSIGADVTVAKMIVHGGHRYYLNGIWGITLSVDAVTKGGEQFDISNEFKTGAYGGIENELFLTDKVVFIITATQRLLIRDAFGNYRWFVSAGFRINL